MDTPLGPGVVPLSRGLAQPTRIRSVIMESPALILAHPEPNELEEGSNDVEAKNDGVRVGIEVDAKVKLPAALTAALATPALHAVQVGWTWCSRQDSRK